MNENLGTLFRMEDGLDALDAWADTATDADKDALYEALFAVVDGSVECSHRVVDDQRRLNEFAVVVRPGLVVKIRVRSFNTFGVRYVGPDSKVSGTEVETGRPA